MATIIEAILGVIIPFILFIVGGYLIKIYKNDEVIKWVTIAVEAAEQIYNGSGMGKEKFEYVKGFILSKFKISDDDLENLIESAVYQINTNKNTKKDTE